MKKTLIRLTLLGAILSGHTLPTLAQQQPEPTDQMIQISEGFRTLGPLTLGMTLEQAQTALGPSSTDTLPQLSPATGLYTKSWLYPEKGVGLSLEAQEPEGPFRVASIILEEPCSWQAVSGISIGMPKSEAESRLKALMADDVEWFGGDSEDKLGVIQTSTYTVLTVGCSQDTVTHIYLGPGPE